MIPFALELYRRHLEGESADALARQTGIPVDRIQQRLAIAAEYTARRERRNTKVAGGRSNHDEGQGLAA